MAKRVAERIPDRGDLVWLDFSPQSGHEHAGRRPALVVSPSAYNGRVGLFLVCPITSQTKGYPFEVPVTSPKDVRGVILADQIKSLDWRARRATVIGKAPPSVIAETLSLIRTLI